MDLANAFILVSALKCYVGAASSKISQDCFTGMDRCIYTETSVTKAYACGSSGMLSAYGLTGDGCKTVANIKYCVCSGDNCVPGSVTSVSSGGGNTGRENDTIYA